jgi:hypothetical protein
MARPARPWFNSDKSCYMAWVGGKRVRLADGPDCPTNRKAATQAIKEITKVRSRNSGLAAGGHTVASVIEHWLRRLLSDSLPYSGRFARPVSRSASSPSPCRWPGATARRGQRPSR